MHQDRFGRPAASVNFGRDEFIPVEWDDTTTADVIYLRGDYAETCLIRKIDLAEKKITWAFGAWADRASLEYGSDRKINIA